MALERVSVAIESDLLRRFDRLLERRRLGNRSEAIRDLIRGRLVEDGSQEAAGEAIGSLTLLYDHEQRELSDRLVVKGHDHRARVVSTLHVHVDDRLCLEVQALRGRVRDLRRFAEQLIGLKGVKHGQLVISLVHPGRSTRRTRAARPSRVQTDEVPEERTR